MACGKAHKYVWRRMKSLGSIGLCIGAVAILLPQAVSAREPVENTRPSITNSSVAPVSGKVNSAEAIPPKIVAQDSRVNDEIRRLEDRIGDLQRQIRETRAADRAYIDRQLAHQSDENSSPDGANIIGNMVFFRGGFIRMNSDRGGEIFTDTLGTTARNDKILGWYAGAGLDLLLSRDAWKMVDRTWVLGEIGVQFNRLESQTVTNAATFAALGVGQQNKVELTMVTISVAPKIKFMEGSVIRPWIIPVGLDIHVISPPSNQTQYLDVGAQFGAGIEFHVYKAFKIGIDARYHLAANMTNTVNSYAQVGPYAGIRF